MILTSDSILAERCKKLRNLCFEKGRRFVHNEIGWNYRMTNMQAALGVAQLEQIDTTIDRKREIGHLYNQLLKNNADLQLPLAQAEYAENIYWVYGLVAKSEEECARIQRQLGELKIGTRPFFWCMHEQPVFNKMGFFKSESYPVAEKIARNGFYIPSGLGITNEQIEEVAESLIKIVANG